MQGQIDDPLFPESRYAKMSWARTLTKTGNVCQVEWKVEIHWWRNIFSGRNFGYKIAERSSLRMLNCCLPRGGGAGGGYPGGGCFVKGTTVLTASGFSPIEKISVNDFVMSYNEQTKKIEAKRVIGKYSVVRNDLVSITVNGGRIICSKNHRFYTCGSWVPAFQLMDEMTSPQSYRELSSLSTNALRPMIPSKIEMVDMGHTVVYNIEVEDNKNYFVGREKILVHNLKTFQDPLNISGHAIGSCFVGDTQIWTPEGQKKLTNLSMGDVIYVRNNNGDIIKSRIRTAYHGIVDEVCVIETGLDQFVCTPNHPFWVRERWTAAKDIQIGDKVSLGSGQDVAVTKNCRKFGSYLVYSVISEYGTNFFVGGQHVEVAQWQNQKGRFTADDYGLFYKEITPIDSQTRNIP